MSRLNLLLTTDQLGEIQGAWRDAIAPSVNAVETVVKDRVLQVVDAVDAVSTIAVKAAGRVSAQAIWRTIKVGFQRPAFTTKLAAATAIGLGAYWWYKSYSTGDEELDAMIADPAVNAPDLEAVIEPPIDPEGLDPAVLGLAGVVDPYARPLYGRHTTIWALVTTALAEFGPLTLSEANRIVVRKFLRDKMRTVGMRDSHVAQHVDRATTLFFLRTRTQVADRRAIHHPKWLQAAKDWVTFPVT